jgi:hypothetical protein
MADTVEMQDIRGLDIDKTVKGFALAEYMFKNAISGSTMSADSLRWYQETAADLTATSPSTIVKAPLATPTNLEVSWTRNTSYAKEYMAECTISEMDIQTADIDVLARTLLRLTRAVVKQVDSDIWDVVTESRTVVNIQTVVATASWDAVSGQDCIEDLLEAIQKIEEYNYDAGSAEVWLSPKDKKNLMTWLVSTKGVNFGNFASERVSDGSLTNILGLKVRSNNVVTADYAVVLIPKAAATWKSLTDTTSRIIEDPGLNRKVRVWERGVCILNDPKAVVLISNTQT